MTQQEFINTFGMTFNEAEEVVLAMVVSNQEEWELLVAKCLNPKKPTPSYFMKYHAKRMRTMQMIKGLGYEVH